jgi:Beta xylosidase C-terminal Concanavalin A-like domain
VIKKFDNDSVYLRVMVSKGGLCHFSYSADGSNFVEAGDAFQAKEGRWIGAKVGIFCVRKGRTNDSGYADFDWFRVEKVKE